MKHMARREIFAGGFVFTDDGLANFLEQKIFLHRWMVVDDVNILKCHISVIKRQCSGLLRLLDARNDKV